MKQSAPWWIFPSWSVRRSQRPDFRFAADLFLRRSSVIAPMRPGPLFPLAHVLKFSHSLLPSAAAPVCAAGSSATTKGHCSKQFKVFVFDRVIRIHPNAAHFTIFKKNTIHDTKAN
jgi:hypothetical protein